MLKSFFATPQSPADSKDTGPGSPEGLLDDDDLLEAVVDNDAPRLARHLQLGGVLHRVRDDERRTLIHVASIEGSTEVLELLLENPKMAQKVNSRDKAHHSALHLAAAIGEEAIATQLIAADAQVDIQDEDGSTPLHHAIKWEHAALVRTLLEFQADPRVPDSLGRCAADMAKDSPDSQIRDVMHQYCPIHQRKAPKASTLEDLKRCLLPRSRRSRQRVEDAREELPESRTQPPPPAPAAKSKKKHHSASSKKPPPPPPKGPVGEKVLDEDEEDEREREPVFQPVFEQPQDVTHLQNPQPKTQPQQMIQADSLYRNPDQLYLNPEQLQLQQQMQQQQQLQLLLQQQQVQQRQLEQLLQQSQQQQHLQQLQLQHSQQPQQGGSSSVPLPRNFPPQMGGTSLVPLPRDFPIGQVAHNGQHSRSENEVPIGPVAHNQHSRSENEADNLDAVEWHGLEPVYKRRENAAEAGVVAGAAPGLEPLLKRHEDTAECGLVAGAAQQQESCTEEYGYGEGPPAAAQYRSASAPPAMPRKVAAPPACFAPLARFAPLSHATDQIGRGIAGTCASRESSAAPGLRGGSDAGREADEEDGVEGDGGSDSSDMHDRESDSRHQPPLPPPVASTAGTDSGKATGVISPVNALFRFQAFFDDTVQRLEFEVQWDTMPPSVGKVVPDGEADRLGVLQGDRIVGCNGVTTLVCPRQDLLPLLKNRPLMLSLERTTEVDPSSPQVEFEADLEGDDDGDHGMKLVWRSRVPSISAVVPGSPAWAAGLLPGDVIYALDGQTALEISEASFYAALRGRDVELTLRRHPMSAAEQLDRFWPETVNRDWSSEEDQDESEDGEQRP